jgi:hypothetical protein
MFLLVQIAWIGIQKWQFNHFAAYAARVWTVEKDDTPEESLLNVQMRALLRWDLISRDYVKFMWVSSEDSKDIDDDTYEGITFTGIAPLMGIYKDQIGETMFTVDNPIPSELMAVLPDIPTTGLIRFETFIPMKKEPEEQPDISNRDNDCEETPCENGNGR